MKPGKKMSYELLSQLGRQGWELAARHDGIAGWILYFKRQICS